MKNLLFLFLFVSGFSSFSQDTLIKKNKDIILCKILEITPNEVLFKKFSFLDGPSYRENVKDIQQIKFANGQVESFGKELKPDVPQIVKVNPDNQTHHLYVQPNADDQMRGMNDASKNYRGYKGAGTATLITTLLFSPVGLVTAVGCSVTPPKESNLMVPNYNSMNNPAYADGYRRKARRMKIGRTWGNFAIGMAVNVSLAIAILSASGY